MKPTVRLHVRPVVDTTRAVLEALARSEGQTYAASIGSATGVHSTQVGRVIQAAAGQGWVTTEWEIPSDETPLGRPPRRLVTVTDQGRRAIQAVLASNREATS